MTFLRRVLKVQAALWALVGVAFVVAPTVFLDHVVDLGGDDRATVLVRLLGVTAVILAMLMVLVSQHVGETWYWAWAFALLEAGVATVSVLHALFGVPDGSGTWQWWLAGVVSIAFCVLDLFGLVRAEQAKPIT
jgi:hypothetical protein